MFDVTSNWLNNTRVGLMYRYMLLAPKGATQVAKTILSPFTHVRNFLSATAFAAANGDWEVHGSGHNVSRKDFCIVCDQDGAVELYHDSDFKFETTSSGVNVSGTTQYMGRQDAGSGPYYSHHYMADAYFIDGTVYTPSDFIETDSDTGVIVPKDSSSVL